MVEMHLLSVNTDFRYDPIYALGVVTSFDRFMQGYHPERDKDSILNALCQSIGGDTEKYRNHAQELLAEVSRFSADEFLAQLKNLSKAPQDGLFATLRAIAENPNFKYSRLFAIGLYTLLEPMSGDLLKDEKRRDEAIQQLCSALNLSADKVPKDIELYRSNLEKVAQAKAVLDDILKADRKKKEERAKAKDTPVASDSSSNSTSESSTETP